jgi:hypothetical protein
MKINWGMKITLLYVAFVMLILIMVSMAMNQKVDLVSKDYYEQELHYQDKIDKTSRTKKLKQQLTWQMNHHALVLKFPDQFKGQHVTGTVHLFRPSDESLDKFIPFSITDTSLTLNIPTDKIKKGIYKMQIDWGKDVEAYYNESVIKFN